MRTIETALWPLEQPTDQVGIGVFLGEEHAPELAGLQEGERVVLVEPNELRAIATVHRLMLDGRIVWFGEIGDRMAIEVIYPSSLEATTPSSDHSNERDPNSQAVR